MLNTSAIIDITAKSAPSHRLKMETTKPAMANPFVVDGAGV